MSRCTCSDCQPGWLDWLRPKAKPDPFIEGVRIAESIYRDDKQWFITILKEHYERKIRDAYAKGYGDANAEIFAAMVQHPKVYCDFIEKNKLEVS